MKSASADRAVGSCFVIVGEQGRYKLGAATIATDRFDLHTGNAFRVERNSVAKELEAFPGRTTLHGDKFFNCEVHGESVPHPRMTANHTTKQRPNG